MRLPSTARATKDLVVDDLVEGDVGSALREALDGGYQGFLFRVKGDP